MLEVWVVFISQMGGDCDGLSSAMGFKLFEGMHREVDQDDLEDASNLAQHFHNFANFFFAQQSPFHLTIGFRQRTSDTPIQFLESTHTMIGNCQATDR